METVKTPENRPLFIKCFKAISRKKLVNDFHDYKTSVKSNDINQCIIDYALKKGLVKI